jgi:hypothetical protein
MLTKMRKKLKESIYKYENGYTKIMETEQQIENMINLLETKKY